MFFFRAVTHLLMGAKSNHDSEKGGGNLFEPCKFAMSLT